MLEMRLVNIDALKVCGIKVCSGSEGGREEEDFMN